MPSIFEPTDPIGSFEQSSREFQVNVEPMSDLTDASIQEAGDESEQRQFRWPLLLQAVVFVILLSRLMNLQITEGRTFRVLAEGNRVETKLLPAPRGEIVDYKGEVLAKNTPQYNLELYPAQLPSEKTDREIIYNKVVSVAGLNLDDIIAKIDKQGLHSIEPIVLKTNLPQETALLWEIEFSNLSGVAIVRLPIRSYETIPGLAHLLGYVGKLTAEDQQKRPDILPQATIGKTGLEAKYDRYLQGKPGEEEIEVDSKGQVQRTIGAKAPIPGQRLELYLNKGLQQKMSEALSDGLKRADRTKGVVVALDPRNGGILGMVSLPSYDNNAFIVPDRSDERSRYFSDKDLPLFNRAVAGTYPPGSTIKPLWAIAGLQEGVIQEKTSIKTPAEIRIGDSVFPDWKYHEFADVKKAIAESNNIFFYAIAGGYDKIRGIGPQKLKEHGEQLGLGVATGVDLPGEASGLLPDPDWKKRVKKLPWYIGDSYHMGIGQGDVLVTPLQIIRSIAAIANGGTVYEPHLVKEVKDANDATVFTNEPKAVGKIEGSGDILRIVREGMRRTVTDGTARPLGELPIEVAGKTGTAQFEQKDKTHAWFVGFAPYNEPTIALAVMVEGGGDSYAVAVPIAKDILAWYSEHAAESADKQ